VALAIVAGIVLSATPSDAVTAPNRASTVTAAVSAQVLREGVLAAQVVIARWGDTLFALAARHCGSGWLFRRLAAASGIPDPDRIYAGRTRVVISCTPAAPAPRPAAASTLTARESRIVKLLAYARAQVGDPYVWAAAGPNSFDCSGLVMASYARVGVRLPHQSGSMLGYGRYVSRANLRPGDVIWPYVQRGTRGHVVIYLGGGKIIESPQPGQRVRVTTLYAFWTARRMI